MMHEVIASLTINIEKNYVFENCKATCRFSVGTSQHGVNLTFSEKCEK